ncbi:MAG: transposase [Cressdnaviricota sp.]|nr:MAG: transposase [Cressdnaviricota sp.]
MNGRPMTQDEALVVACELMRRVKQWTDEDIEQLWTNVRGARNHEQMRRREQKKAERLINTQLITVSFDQKMENVEEEMERFIDEVTKARYECLDGAIAVCEFYGDEGNWNPHVHIATYRVKAPSVVGLAIKKKVKSKFKDTIYNVNYVEAHDDRHMKYVKGEKRETKGESLTRDKEHRASKGLEELYHL